MAKTFFVLSSFAIIWGIWKGPILNRRYDRWSTFNMTLYVGSAAAVAFGFCGALVSYLFLIGFLPHAR